MKNQVSLDLRALSIFLVGWALLVFPVGAQVYEKMFDFTQARAAGIETNPTKGSWPYAGLVQGGDGSFYGTTFRGASGFGTVFKVTSGGVLTTLVEFTENGATNKGSDAYSGLLYASNGNFYGTTNGGGATLNGTIFKMTPGGILTTLVEFTNNGATSKGSRPYGGLVQGSDGNFYGTTTFGGTTGYGTVYRMSPSGTLTTLVEFTGNGATNKGSLPYASLVQESDGNFYGTTSSGGAGDHGTVFQMTPAGVLTTLVEFTSNGTANKGSRPEASLLRGDDGSFYGTTASGGESNYGTIFKMTPAGELTTLVEFTRDGATNKGSRPSGALIQGSDGNFYGTTANGGIAYGTVFKMTPSGILTTLVGFTLNGATNKGSRPYCGLVQGSDGNVYGTTTGNGDSDNGTIFKMTPAGVLTTLVEFRDDAATNKGSRPDAGLTQGGDGNFYGTTGGGGTGSGSVFQMTPAGVLTTLVKFTGNGPTNKGQIPEAGLLQYSDGNFYGTTRIGGESSSGTIFKMTPAGAQTTLVNFTNNGASNKGLEPRAGLVLGSDGNFYGTTIYGGANNYGTVFQMTPAGVLTTLVEFNGSGVSNNGRWPGAGLVQGSDGNFYGTTVGGGSIGSGSVFQMTPAGILTTLVGFTGSGGTHKGSSPYAGLVQGSDGNFYGTTLSGGASGNGTVFRMTPAGVLTTLVEFTNNGATNKGRRPEAGLVQGSDGNFYGTTFYGGASDYGTVFQMTPAGVLTTLVQFTSIEDGYPSAELMQGADGALYGTTKGPDGSIYRLLFSGSPLIGVIAVAPQGSTNAVVQAKANARGIATSVTVEYGTDGVNFPNTLPVWVNLNGFQSKLVGTTLTGLAPGTIYFFRFRAVSTAGTTLTPAQSFSTLAEPLVTTTPATDIAPVSARFNGTVNARNYDATVRFEWGTNGNSFPNTVNATPTTVAGYTDVSVSAPVAGLVKGITYFYRIVATNAGGTTVSGTQSFRTLTEPTASIGGNFALTTTSVRVEGAVNAQGSDSGVVFEYGTDGVSFPNSVTATPGTVTGSGSTPVSAVLTTLSQGATYHYRIRATSAGGTGITTSASFSMNVLSGFAQVFPAAPPDAQGFLFVNLAPGGILHGWRFVGERQWRSSGVPVGGLTTGDRNIEFRPVPGYIQPPREAVSVISGEPATILTRDYYETTSTGSGGLTVTLKPEALANPAVPEATRAQWRLLGEDDTQWRNSATSITGLSAGAYLIECKPVAGRTTPVPANVIVNAAQTAAPTITYFLPDAPTGTPPAVLAFEAVTTDQTKPYAHVGQLRSNVGSSTGFVVKQRVVATAAHVVWDDGTLSAVQGLQWLHQQHRGTYEPKPIAPRGFYIFDGYAAQRLIDNSPGDSSAQSQTLDVAAIYFNEDAGRGGYGGFLASDLAQNEFLLSNANKILVGYPVDGVATTSQGRMFATPPANVNFTAALGRTFTTAGIRGFGGNSGGPLCVQFEGGSYYPAAIYLGGTNQTVVRAIDSGVIDLFNRAAVSGNGGDNNTGGGITHSSITSFGNTLQPGVLEVTIQPAAARNAGAGWRLKPETSYRLSGGQQTGLNAGDYILQLNTVSGFKVPTPQTVPVIGGQLSELTFTYEALNLAPSIGNVTNQTINEDASTGPIAFPVSDPDNSAGSLVVTGSSSNTSLLPNANIVFGGNGANRTVTVTPAANQSGIATITLTVSDGSLTDTDTFVLTVNAVNDAPTLTSVADQGVATNTATAAVPLTIGDMETAASALTLSAESSNTTLVPLANITFGGSGANRTVTVDPAANQLGSSTITITVGDGSLNAGRSFLLTVTGTARETWRFANFGSTSNTGLSANNADPDGDGQSNIDEYAANTDPNNASDRFTILTSTKGPSSFAVTAAGKAGRSYTLERSQTLTGPWTSADSTGPLATNGPVELTDSSPPANNGFYRIRVTFP